MVAVQKCCCGRLTNCKLFTADVEEINALSSMFDLVV
jgi:hypothetical protein